MQYISVLGDLIYFFFGLNLLLYILSLLFIVIWDLKNFSLFYILDTCRYDQVSSFSLLWDEI